MPIIAQRQYQLVHVCAPTRVQTATQTRASSFSHGKKIKRVYFLLSINVLLLVNLSGISGSCKLTFTELHLHTVTAMVTVELSPTVSVFFSNYMMFPGGEC